MDRWKTKTSDSLDGLLQAHGAVGRKLVASRAQEQVDLFLERGARREATGDEPQQLPAALLACRVAVVGELLEQLTIHFIFECFLFGWINHKHILFSSKLQNV